MLNDLINQANQLLSGKEPSDEALFSMENAISSYLEALATERLSEDVSLEAIEDANRLLKEIWRERARRLGGINSALSQPVNGQGGNRGEANGNRSSKLISDEQPDALKEVHPIQPRSRG